MPEMTPAERVALDTLRKSALAQMSDADFANLEAEVALKGIRNLDGWFASEVRKAVEQVLKHPGHANQAVHGGGKGKGGASGSSADSAPAGGAGSAGDQGVAQAEKILANAKDGAMYTGASDIKREREMMGKTNRNEAIGRAHKHDTDYQTAIADSNAYAKRASEIRAARTRDPKAEKVAEKYDTDSRRFQTEAAISMSLASAWSSVAMELGASESDLARVQKELEPVVKHPGHPDQSVHGGARRKGGASASASAPASSGGGRNPSKEDEAADKVGMGANYAAENMGAHANELQQKIYGSGGASRKMTPIDEVELMGIQDSLSSAAESLTMISTGKRDGQREQIMNVRRQLTETKSDARRALSPAVRGVTLSAIDNHIAEVDDLLSVHREAWTGVGGVFEKAVEPVVKHPGQHDQSVHGGGKGGGTSPSATPAPASSGGSSAPSFKVGDKVEFTDKYGGGKTTLVRGRVVGITPKGKLKIKPKNPRQHGTLRTIDPKRVSEGHSAPDPSRSRAGRLGAKTRSDNERPPTYTSML